MESMEGIFGSSGGASPGSALPTGSGRALVVEESLEGGASWLASRLGETGFEVRACSDGRTAFEAFIRELPDLIVTRDRVGEIDGLELARRVREVSGVPVVLVDPVAPTERRERAFRIGVDRVVSEPEELARLPWIALELVAPGRHPDPPPRLTAAHVRQVARSQLQAELERLLLECRGNLAEMARRMGKDRSTVRYHLRRFGMLVEERANAVEIRGRAASRADGQAREGESAGPS